MAIYRGPGGAGDATGDATNASTLALAAKDEAQASATSAASSATAAANSATAADTSADEAATSATNAAGSATTASTAATNSANSATAADTSADEAAASASDADDSATAAASSASTATTQASNAASSASAASTSASNASTSATNASNSATSAASSATAAAASAVTAATFDPALFLAKSGNLSGLASTATARDNLGVEIGVDVQAFNAALAAIAANNGTNMMKNRIINGAMMIDQRNAGASVGTSSGSSAYIVDRFFVAYTQTSKMTGQQNAGSVTPPVGFTNYLGITSSSAYSVLTGDTFGLFHRIEGFNVSDLGWGTANAQPVTMSFWVRSSLTGTFGGALQNSAADRSYPFSYTISSANTWEQKSITISGDTTGTWLTNNSLGIQIVIGLGSGSTFSGTANAWAAGNFRTVTGATSVVGTSGATFYITGVQLEKGSTATSFDYRTYGTELALCQRYYEVLYASSGTVEVTGTQRSASNFWSQWSFAVTKRATPTVSLTSAGSWSEGTPTIYPSTNYVQFNRAGSYYATGSSGAAILQSSIEL